MQRVKDGMSVTTVRFNRLCLKHIQRRAIDEDKFDYQIIDQLIREDMQRRNKKRACTQKNEAH